MNSGFGLLLMFGIGVVAGLRSVTAPAVVAWAAHTGLCLGGGHLHSWRLSGIRCRSTPRHSRPHGCRPAYRPNGHGLSYRRMPRRRWGRVALAWSADRGDRRNCRRVRRLSGSHQTGSGPTRFGYCDRHPGRSGCDRAGTAAGFQILKTRHTA